MKHYRILKVSEGKCTYYLLQNRIFFFFWDNMYLPTREHLGYTSYIGTELVRFSSEETAFKVLKEFMSPTISYKEHIIHKEYSEVHDCIYYRVTKTIHYVFKSLKEAFECVDEYLKEKEELKNNPKTTKVVFKIKR